MDYLYFSAPSIRAIHLPPATEIRKTQTRRLGAVVFEPGQRVWIREEWAVAKRWDGWQPSGLSIDVRDAGPSGIWYPAGGTGYGPDGDMMRQISPLVRPEGIGRIRGGRYMPRWASRSEILVVSVREEPLQAITEADAKAEGATGWANWLEVNWLDCKPGAMAHRTNLWLRYHRIADPESDTLTARSAYAAWWDTLHGEDGEHSWRANPTVAVTEFRLIENPEAPLPIGAQKMQGVR